MTDRFDLEQHILETWRITDDIKDLANNFESMSDDERSNYLIGLQAIYEVKFQKLWETFEKMVYSGQFIISSNTRDEAYDEPIKNESY
jgi:hypothetical protein